MPSSIHGKSFEGDLQSGNEGFSNSKEDVSSIQIDANNEHLSVTHVNYWIPFWLPEESLFSLISRAHSLSQNRRADTTTLELFGHHRIGCAHDMPARIDELVRRTNGRLGNAETLIRQRTVLAAYLPLLDQRTAAQAIGALRSDSIGPLKTQLGLLASGFGADHPLRACPACMEDDREVYGVAYWHMPHQWPGVWFCTRHQRPLLRFRLKSNGVERFLWHTPEEAELAPVADLTSHDGLTPELESLLAGLSHGINTLSHGVPGDRLNRLKVANTFKLKLLEKGFMSTTGRLRNIDAGEAFSCFLSPLASFTPLMSLSSTPTQALSRIQHMIGYEGRQPRHPVTHVATALWLFGSWEHFIQAYKRSDDASGAGFAQTRSIRRRQGNPYSAQLREQLLQLVTQAKLSPTAAAQQIGVDTQTAVMWTTQAGLDVKTRSKKLTSAMINNVIACLERAEPKRDIAEQNGLSMATVTRLLLSDSDLALRWHDQIRNRLKNDHRSHWLEAVAATPAAGIKEIRQKAPAAYAWLYRNDRSWLEDQKQQLPNKVLGNHRQVDWTERDRIFSSILSAQIRSITNRSSNGTASMRDLIKALPQLRAQMHHLEIMPLTAKVLNRKGLGKKN